MIVVAHVGALLGVVLTLLGIESGPLCCPLEGMSHRQFFGSAIMFAIGLTMVLGSVVALVKGGLQ